jgi:4-hydroxythreonine-4-phosphate dehydrogenase
VVCLERRTRAASGVIALDLDTRARPERAARRIVRAAISSRAAKRARILFKKIDSTLRGHVAAELASAARGLPASRPVVFAPAFPAQHRTVRSAHLYVAGLPGSGDLRALVSRAGLPASLIEAAGLRRGAAAAMRDALATGARALVCDATNDADLDAIARAGLALRPRPLFVGSAGLARAIARSFGRQKLARRAKAEARPVTTVVGSAAPVSVAQALRLSRSRALAKTDLLVQIEWTRAPVASDMAAVRRLGRIVAQHGPRSHYVLTGGETARAVLGACGIRELRLLGEVEPGVPYGITRDGTLVCTKAGGFGKPGTLAKCAARLKREMKRS